MLSNGVLTRPPLDFIPLLHIATASTSVLLALPSLSANRIGARTTNHGRES